MTDAPHLAVGFYAIKRPRLPPLKALWDGRAWWIDGERRDPTPAELEGLTFRQPVPRVVRI